MKVQLLFVSLLLACSASAQIAKNQVIAGASLGAQRTVTESADSSNNFGNIYEFSGKHQSVYVPFHAGYMASSRLALGISGSLSYYRTTQRYKNTFIGSQGPFWNENSSVARGKQFSVGAFARIYQPLNSRFFFHLHVSGFTSKGEDFMVISSSNQSMAPQVKDTVTTLISGYGLSLSPGLTCFITKRIGIELQSGGFSYNAMESAKYMNKNKVGTDKRAFLNLQNFLAFTFGVTFYFGSPETVPPGKGQ